MLKSIFTQKLKTYKYICFLLIFITVALACNHNNVTLTLDAGDFQFSQKTIESFFLRGSIDKIVIPETTESSLFSSVDQIAFGKDDDIYLADLFSQKTVYKFDRLGKFVCKYGRIGQGPGEYSAPIAFDKDEDGRVLLLADTKIVVYNKNGELEKETNIYELGGDIKNIGDEIYTRFYVTRRGGSNNNNILKVYDRNLEFKRGLFQNDPRLNTYRFLPRHSMAPLGRRIVFTDVYDLAINIYDPKSKVCQRINFPSENDKLASVWNKRHFTEADRSTIRDNIHRFNDVFSIRETIYLTEIIRNKKEVNFWLLDLGRKYIEVYPLLDLIGDGKKATASIRFDYIVGAYNRGLIFVIDDVNKFEQIRKQFPQFANIQFGNNDNPMLVFYRLDGFPSAPGGS